MGIWVIFLLAALVVSPVPVMAQTQDQPELPPAFSRANEGRFEIGLHFSFWSLNLLKGLLEGEVADELGEEIRDEITAEVGGSYAGLVKAGYEQELIFDSGGHNYGLELRYYPQGRDGGFSFGLAVDKARMRLQVDGDLVQSFGDGTAATATAFGEIVLNPVFTSLSFRWDVLPRSMISPYFNMGVGIAALNGEFNYEYAGLYTRAGYVETIGDSEQQTLKQAEEDMSVNLPNVIPLLQLHLGVRAELLPNLNIKAEAGIWDGFLLRFGVAGRF